jgi:hypothetical protein
MVRAGVVDHPAHWVNGGYREIQQPPKRYTLIDLSALLALCDFSKLAAFQQSHRQWVDEALHGALGATRWTMDRSTGGREPSVCREDQKEVRTQSAAPWP